MPECTGRRATGGGGGKVTQTLWRYYKYTAMLICHHATGASEEQGLCCIIRRQEGYKWRWEGFVRTCRGGRWWGNHFIFSHTVERCKQRKRREGYMWRWEGLVVHRSTDPTLTVPNQLGFRGAPEPAGGLQVEVGRVGSTQIKGPNLDCSEPVGVPPGGTGAGRRATSAGGGAACNFHL